MRNRNGQVRSDPSRPAWRILLSVACVLAILVPCGVTAHALEPAPQNSLETLRLYQISKKVDSNLGAHETFVAKAKQSGNYTSVTRFQMYLGGVNAQHGRVDLSIRHWHAALDSSRKAWQQNRLPEVAEMELQILKELSGMYARQGNWRMVDEVHTDAMATLSRHLQRYGVRLESVENSISSIPYELLNAYIDLHLQAIHIIDFYKSPKDALTELTRITEFLKRVLKELEESGADSYHKYECRRRLLKAMNGLVRKLNFMQYEKTAAVVTQEIRSLLEPNRIDVLSLPVQLDRLESKENVPVQARIEEMKTLIQTQNGTHAYSFYHGNLNLAAFLSELGRIEETFQIIDDIVADAEVMNDRALRVDALDMGITLRLNHNVLDGLEQRLIEVLLFYRTCGLKKFEPSLYYSYARFLIKKERYREAVCLLDAAYKMNYSLGLLNGCLDNLLLLQKAYLAMGANEQIRSTFRRIEDILPRQHDTTTRKQLRVYTARLDYYAFLEDVERYRQEYLAAESFITNHNLSDAERGAFSQYKPQLDVATAASSATSVSSTASKKPPLRRVDLQPLTCSTLVLAEEFARGRFTLSNPSMHTSSGILQIDSSLGVSEWKTNELEHLITLSHGPKENSVSKELTLLPNQQIYVCLRTLVKGSNEQARVTITWEDTRKQIASWEVGLAAVFRMSSIVSANYLVESPFYSVPIFHELYYRGDEQVVQDIKVEGSIACRIEIWDDIANNLLAIDENGDGNFSGSGDVVYQDENRNGYPDVAMNPENAVAVLQLLVFPYRQTWPSSKSELSLSILLRDDDSSEWSLNAIDNVNLRDRNTE